jgi:hypothetical protein
MPVAVFSLSLNDVYGCVRSMCSEFAYGSVLGCDSGCCVISLILFDGLQNEPLIGAQVHG